MKTMVPITPTMHIYNIQRQNLHVSAVQGYAKLFVNYCIDFERKFDKVALLKSVANHDKNKEGQLQDIFAQISWTYFLQSQNLERFEIEPNDKNAQYEATIKHRSSSTHHPEYWDTENDIRKLINPSNRDLPTDTPINATKMPFHSVAEMVADWAAVSLERDGEVSPRKWINRELDLRIRFTQEQKEFIYLLTTIIETVTSENYDNSDIKIPTYLIVTKADFESVINKTLTSNRYHQ